jgi:ABC-type transporter Mla MlaB component
MEPAPARSRPSNPPAEGPTPKLTIEKFADGGIACLRFAGTIDEAFEGKKLGLTATGDVLVIDLGGVKKISSFGIREWVDFIGTASRQVRSVILIECAPKVVDQLNMVANFAGGGRVFSFYAPFRCDYCDSEHRVLLQGDRDHETIKTMKLAERPCPACKEGMYFDEDGATFFSYVIAQDRFELPPAVATFLATRLDYAVRELDRKLRVDKVIEGRTTYLRLTGDLDRTFPRDKLAEGLEGAVIVDLGGIGRIEPAGAAEWRSFVQVVTPLVEQLYLVAVPPSMLEKLGGKDDLGAKAQVLTLTLPYRCSGCGTTAGQLIDVAEHHAVLKFATAPELRCSCKTMMTCVASESLMTVLPGLPRPAASAELVKSLAGLRERSHASVKRTAEPRATGPAARRSPVVLILATLLVIVLAAAGVLVYQRVSGERAGVATTPAGQLTNRSAPVRPGWIAGDTPATATCRDATGNGLTCTGISSLVARQDDAEDEAAEAALDAVANAIAVRITDPRWTHAVPPIYAAARDAKLAAFDRDPASTTARREVREARHAVAQALRATANGAVPSTPTGRYWEEYAGPDGKRTLAFAQISIGATELATLVEAYTRSASALGATVVGNFPLVGWRHPRVERGAILATLGDGPLAAAGLSEQMIVLSVDGRDVSDAASFAQIAGDQHAALGTRGGTLRLKIQTVDPTPREFTTTIKGAVETSPAAGSGKRPHPGNPPPGTGSVNVWDKLGGNRGSGRDDPTQ